MNNESFNISRVARLLGVTAQTLRRWDEDGLLPVRRKTPVGFRFYAKQDVERFAQEQELDLEKMAKGWAMSADVWEPLSSYHCLSSNIFQLRLQTLEAQLSGMQGIELLYPLLSSAAGEIGNNSFDHNLGNWPDVPGTFFGCDKKRRKIVLADRGQGILSTLARVRPSLKTHAEAVRVAFTEIVTGRAPEHRGNGLKFVRRVVVGHPFALTFQTGDAVLRLRQDSELLVSPAVNHVRGCMAVITF